MELTRKIIKDIANRHLDKLEAEDADYEHYEYIGINEENVEYCSSKEHYRNTLITFPEIVNYESLFEFNELSIKESKFMWLFKKYVPASQLVGCSKIIFITDERSLESVYDRYEDIDIEDNVGLFYYTDSVVLINIMLIREMVDDTVIFEGDKEKEYNIGVWTTLLHEIRHSLCEISMIDELLPKEAYTEENVETYAINVFEDMECRDDYMCFNI